MPQMSPFVQSRKLDRTPKQKMTDFLNVSKSNIEFEANSSKKPRVSHLFFTPNLNKKKFLDKSLEKIRFDLYTS